MADRDKVTQELRERVQMEYLQSLLQVSPLHAFDCIRCVHATAICVLISYCDSAESLSLVLRQVHQQARRHS
jgi:hypothetical protein